jgi:tRNA dimethylallyltransferase
MKKPKILVILGPTSTGKTDLSIKIASKFNGEIISADSRQVYKGLDLLSGKVTEKEADGIPHYMIDVTSLGEKYSVARYKKDAKVILEEILNRKKLPIIVGGTGFYIDSLVYDIDFPEVTIDPDLRDSLERKTVGELFEILEEIDPDRAQNIDSQNPVRLVRAIEIATSLGKNPPAPTYDNSPYEPLFIGLDLPDEELQTRISSRIENRLGEGMIDEAKNILDSGIPTERFDSLGLDAKYSADVAQDKISVDDLRSGLATETWHFAKRQRTWWKKNEKIMWFNPLSDTEKIELEIESFLKNN